MTEESIQNPPVKCASSPSKWLLVILIVAAFLRLAFLGSSPPSLFRDEVEKGYNAWSLVKSGYALSVNVPTGNNPIGIQSVKLPLFLNVYNSHTSMIYQYLDAPFMLILGRNAHGVRAAAALAGILTVLFTFLFVREWKDEKTALWAAAFLAVSPWHVIFSRWAQQGIMVPLFITIGLYTFYRGLGEAESEIEGSSGKSLRWWLISAAAFALAFYAYAAARVFIPIFLLLLFGTHAKTLVKKWKWFAAATVLFLILSVPTVFFMLSPESRERYSAVSGGSSIPTFLLNWLKHFSPGFLFFNGDANLRHSFPGFGQLHVFEILLWLAAIPAFLCLPRRVSILLIGWLMLFPVPASLTTEGVPHALRSVVALPLPAIISAIGLMEISRYLKKRLGANSSQESKSASLKRYLLVVRMAGTLAAVVVVYFIYVMFVEYPKQAPQYWSYPENAVFQSDFMNNIEDDSEIFVSSRLFYAPYFALFYLDGRNDWEFLMNTEKNLLLTFPNQSSDIGNFVSQSEMEDKYLISIPPSELMGKVVEIIPWPDSMAHLVRGVPAAVVVKLP